MEETHAKSSLVRYCIPRVALRSLLTSEDVQLTKDDEPIIYHDFLMSETGIDAPLHNLSMEQVIFKLLSVPWIAHILSVTVQIHQRGPVSAS